LDDLYQRYHDEEWGVESHDDHHLFEQLVLETFQAGLSWHTILKKRANFRKAFDNFDPRQISNYSENKIESLLQNEGIIRHRGKIEATRNNAKCFLEVVEEQGSFESYIWGFVQGKRVNSIRHQMDLVTTSPESDAMSKSLKMYGFRFIGSTTCYAFMQAIGMVDDHFDMCWRKTKEPL